MKVILEAFNGKLKSEPLDFPEDVRPEIQMVLDFRPMNILVYDGPIPDMPLTKRGRFIYTGTTYLLPNNMVARKYVLIEVS